jgi:hypothetical protein
VANPVAKSGARFVLADQMIAEVSRVDAIAVDLGVNRRGSSLDGRSDSRNRPFAAL